MGLRFQVKAELVQLPPSEQQWVLTATGSGDCLGEDSLVHKFDPVRIGGQNPLPPGALAAFEQRADEHFTPARSSTTAGPRVTESKDKLTKDTKPDAKVEPVKPAKAKKGAKKG